MTKEVFITVATDKQVRVLAAESTDAHVKVRLEPVAGDAGKVKLTATQKADAPEGYHHGSIVIKTTSASKPELKLIVWGTVEERPADSTDVEN